MGAVQLVEQADRAGEGGFEVGAQLVAYRDPVADQVLAGPAGLAQGDGGRGVRQQRAQPGPVGAQRIGQHERVEPVVLVTRRPVPRPQVLHLARGDHHHRHPGIEQGIDDRPVTALDRGLARPRRAQPADQLRQPGRGVLHDEPGHDLTRRIDHAHGVIGAGPVDSRGHAARRRRGQRQAGILHDSLLAASPVGRHPVIRCRDAAACPLTDRRSAALSPVDGRRVPGNRQVPQN